MNRRAAFALMACAFAAPVASAAQSMGGVSYSWSLPTGDLHNFIDNDSWVGFSLEGRKFVQPNMSVGIFLAWNEFYENTNELIDLGNVQISGDQYRNLNAFPLMLSGHFYTGRAGDPRFYVGLNAGAYYMRQLMDIGVFTFETDNWHAGVAPEVGVMFPARRGTNVLLRAIWHYPFSSGEYLAGEARSFQYLSVGVAFMQSKGRGY